MPDWHDAFLEDLDPRPWTRADGAPTSLKPAGFFLGGGEFALEVVLADAGSKPRNDGVRRLWHARQGGRASPLLLIVGYPDHGETKVVMCGPAGEQPPIVTTSLPQAERLARASLGEPSRHAAVRFLASMLPEVDTDLPGVRNAGLLANHELQHGVPQRTDWRPACDEGRRLLGLGGWELVEGLGFRVEQLGTTATVLATARSKRGVAVFLDEGETFDDPATRFSGTSPVSHALALADRENLPWVVLTRHRQVRLYAARPDTGVGRKGRADTYVELNLALVPDDRAGYLPLLFGSGALDDGGTLDQILETSGRFATGLAVRLRERVYYDCVPSLAEAIAARLSPDGEPTDTELAFAYECTLTVLFRLLFVAYAEDKDLLPYRTNSKYADHSLKLIARRLSEDRRKDFAEYDAEACEHWEDVKQLWRAVDKGNKSWGVPPYNGGLFSSDAVTNQAGHALTGIELSDPEFAPALSALLVDESAADGVIGPVDFRSLSVREFGTIYEGLLESKLAVAPTDLTVDKADSYVPVRRAGDEVWVEEGAIYFHNRSGARKASGSYFTKPFAVEHLLDHALEPALADHVDRLARLHDAGDDAAAAAAFFDSRCVDLAMGSGHFLTAAVDRIEARLSAFLALHPIGPVHAELDALRRAALDALGDLADGVEIETTTLLRRLVARRCVYGVDLNPMAVELARLSLWIHTFVPGLPLSFLSHNLVVGNSLTGVGTISEVLAELDPDHDPDRPSLFRSEIEALLERASGALTRLGTVTESTVADVKAAAAAHAEAEAAVKPARRLFDLVVAARLGKAGRPQSFEDAVLQREWMRVRAGDVTGELQALHFPAAFPEVFLRDRPGFDCILGNPPWEEATVEKLNFWALRFPGLKSMTQADQRREVAGLERARPDLVEEYGRELAAAEALRDALVAGPFPGMGTGDPDVYKAFCWRFWKLARDGGAVGVVLPRSALSAAGSAPWRLEVLEHGCFDDVTMTLNSGGWMFDDAEHRYTIGLITLRKGAEHAGAVHLRGPFRSLPSFREGVTHKPAEFAVDEFLSWSEGASFPLIPNERAVSVFQKLRAHPRLDAGGPGWSARPTTEFHATNDKEHFDFDPADTAELFPVYKGASFNLWPPDTGTYYGWADPDEVTEVLQEKRVRSGRRANSVWSAFEAEWVQDPDTLPCWYPRLAFRDITNRTNKRTVISALVPGSIVMTNKAPYLLWPEGDARDEAFLLGVLCSIPLDWYARRVVEISLNFHLLNGFPIPRAERDAPLRRRVEQLAGCLAAVDERYEHWAESVGVPVGLIGTSEEKDDAIAELDAVVAHLYGLSESDLVTIFETFHEGWNHEPRLRAVLAHHRRLA